MWRERVLWCCEVIGCHSLAPVRGCADSEIRGLAERTGLEVPEAHGLFLRLVGGEPGDFMRGYDLRFSVSERLDQRFRLLVSEMRGPPIPPGALVYFGSQDFQFWFMLADDGPDPKVFTYVDSDPTVFSEVGKTFSEDLERLVSEQYGVEFLH